MFQIAFAFSKPTEKELLKKGFIKQEVYIKYTTDKKVKAEKEIFAMENPPYQFCATNYWGVGVD